MGNLIKVEGVFGDIRPEDLINSGIVTTARQYTGQRRAEHFSEMTMEDLLDVLNLTIKADNENKIMIFLAYLSAFTEDNQMNISLNAPSSTGKSYIPIEISALFPKEDVIIVGYCSPTAFFHDWGFFNKQTKQFDVNLERKIIVFLDQPQTLLLERLRPLISHDKKEIEIKITDKSKSHGLKTKNVILRGYSSIIFCSAAFLMDEQELTRFILLSPEITQGKIRQGIEEVIRKEENAEAYCAELNKNPKRHALIERIRAIRDAQIKDIRIHDLDRIRTGFYGNRILQPRHQRDIKKAISIIKSVTLLNLWHRQTDDPGVLLTTDSDIDTGFKIWKGISHIQELNISPHLYSLFTDIIVPLYRNSSMPITRKDILKEHFRLYDHPLETHKLNRDILPMLENAGLIEQEHDPNDKKRLLITPIIPTNADETGEDK